MVKASYTFGCEKVVINPGKKNRDGVVNIYDIVFSISDNGISSQVDDKEIFKICLGMENDEVKKFLFFLLNFVKKDIECIIRKDLNDRIPDKIPLPDDYFDSYFKQIKNLGFNEKINLLLFISLLRCYVDFVNYDENIGGCMPCKYGGYYRIFTQICYVFNIKFNWFYNLLLPSDDINSIFDWGYLVGEHHRKEIFSEYYKFEKFIEDDFEKKDDYVMKNNKNIMLMVQSRLRWPDAQAGEHALKSQESEKWKDSSASALRPRAQGSHMLDKDNFLEPKEKTKKELEQEKLEVQTKWLKEFFDDSFNQRVPKEILIKKAADYLGISVDDVNKIIDKNATIYY